MDHLVFSNDKNDSEVVVILKGELIRKVETDKLLYDEVEEKRDISFKEEVIVVFDH
jgi:hypothetical protein